MHNMDITQILNLLGLLANVIILLSATAKIENRFTKVEKDLQWLKESLGIKIN